MTAETFLREFDTFNHEHDLVVKNVYCDQGSNFRGANNILNSENDSMSENFEFFLKDFIGKDEVLRKLKQQLKVNFHFGQSKTSHAQGYIESFVKLFKVSLYRVIGPFGAHRRTEDISISQFRNILSHLKYAINKRPLTPISTENADLDFITPASFLKCPVNKTPDFKWPMPDFREHFTKSRTLCEKYTHQIWELWLSLYLPSLFDRQKWFSDIKPFCLDDLVLYKTKDKFNKNYPLGRVVELISGTDKVVRHLKLILENRNSMIIPVHDACRLEEDM